MDSESLRVPLGKKINLTDYDAGWVPKWAKKENKQTLHQHAAAVLDANKQELIGMQELLWASNTYAMLIILQGMDAAGKDGTIRHVMSGVNPQGCRVTSFKTPTEEELDHDFLWRHNKALPERGSIGIFNRSYYEDVLIVKVRPEILAKQQLPPANNGDDFWVNRYQDINNFEQHLVRNGTIVLKFYLNLSKKQQKRRLLKRLDDPDKEWKFSLGDLAERSKWNDYMDAYEEMLNQTNTEWAPWYVVPADKKWVMHAVVSEVLVKQIKKLHLSYPVLSKPQKDALKQARAELQKE
ncbi:MAG: polyphosphate kinase 2 family protein [Candidatus Bathyarchaeota archaeon]|nr:polyphosphate kinase 2 family protein [Candidatus Bathyarchaeota archaeon]